jgi:hypothetical protein
MLYTSGVFNDRCRTCNLFDVLKDLWTRKIAMVLLKSRKPSIESTTYNKQKDEFRVAGINTGHKKLGSIATNKQHIFFST